MDIEVLENWYVCVAFLGMFIIVTCAIISFVNLSTEKKIANVKEWLKYAVMECEKELGSKTGQAKLAMCYDMAVQRFPWILKLVSFSTFSEWVSESLEWLNKQLASNKAIVNYVEGTKNEF